MAKNFIAGEGVDVDVDDVAGTATLSVPEASSGQATAGTNSTMRMSPRRVKEAIEAIGVVADDLAADGGGMLGIPARGAPAYIRSIEDIIQAGGFSFKNDFVPAANGSRSGATISGTDDAPKLQNAVDEAAGLGVPLTIEPGGYALGSKVTMDLSDTTTGRKAIIRGAGSMATKLYAAGGANVDCLQVNGTFPSVDNFEIGGFSIERPDNGTTYGTGRGLALLGLWNARVFDIYTFRNPRALDLTGSLLLHITNFRSYYDKVGAYGAVNLTSPNDINFVSCDFRASYSRGAQFTGSTNLKFLGCTFEGIGVENTGDANSAALDLISLGQAGPHGVECSSHFEANYGRDVQIMHDIFPCMYSFAGSHFLRTGTPTQTNSLYLQATAGSISAAVPGVLDVRGTMFGGLPYTGGSPNYSPSSSKRRVAFNVSTHASLTFLDRMSNYTHGAERPIIPSTVMRPVENTVIGTITDGSPPTISGYGISAVSKPSTGNYLLTIAGGANGFQVTSLVPITANVHSFQGYQENSTQVRIILRDSAGNGMDGSFQMTGAHL